MRDVSGLALGLVLLAFALPAAADGNVRGALTLAGVGIASAYLEILGRSDVDDGESGGDGESGDADGESGDGDAESSAGADDAIDGEPDPYVIDPGELDPTCASCGRPIEPDRDRCEDCASVGSWRK